MPLPVTALYGAILGLMMLVLAGLAGRARAAANVSLGDGGNPTLLEAIRRHGNFIEFVPFIVLMMAILELNGASKTQVHAIGIALIACRIAHAIGLRHDVMATPARIVGAGGTFLITLYVVVLAALQSLGIWPGR